FRIWTNRPAQALLYGSFFVHYALALSALWQRRTLRLRASELAQLILGFAIPLLLVRHVVGTRIADSFFHTDVGYYAYLLWIYFVRLRARVVDEFEKAEHPRGQIARERGRGDGLGEIAGRVILADRRRPRVDLELEKSHGSATLVSS